MLEQHAVARLEREELLARRRAPQLVPVDEPHERGEGEAAAPEGRGGRRLGDLVLARALLGERLEAGVDGDPVVAGPVESEGAARRAVGAPKHVGDDGVGEGELTLRDERVHVVLVDVLAAQPLDREAARSPSDAIVMPLTRWVRRTASMYFCALLGSAAGSERRRGYMFSQACSIAEAMRKTSSWWPSASMPELAAMSVRHGDVPMDLQKRSQRRQWPWSAARVRGA